MVGGQVVDIESEGKTISPEMLDYIHLHKTAALIRASLRVGARLAGAGDAQVAAISQAGQALGLAFQIVDDILDIEGATAEMGKTAGSDLRRQKATYPALLGLEESRRQAAHLLQEAKDALRPLGEKGAILAALADFIGSRRH